MSGLTMEQLADLRADKICWANLTPDELQMMLISRSRPKRKRAQSEVKRREVVESAAAGC